MEKKRCRDREKTDKGIERWSDVEMETYKDRAIKRRRDKERKRQKNSKKERERERNTKKE